MKTELIEQHSATVERVVLKNVINSFENSIIRTPNYVTVKPVLKLFSVYTYIH
jgi:hypothetical protein